MTASRNIYNSERLAAGYAYNRPSVHPHIIARLSDQLKLKGKLSRALDIGCGAGLSTAALEPLAETVVGIDPFDTMLKHRAAVSTQADFMVASAERLPFTVQAFDLLTAAGALNYVELDRFFPEAVRVLNPSGWLVIYDFSEGRRLRGDHSLEDWHLAFKQRYPAPPGYALDVKNLAYERYGLRLQFYEEFEVAVPLTLQSYLLYAMSETRVELAISQGMPEAEIRNWCAQTLAEIFDVSPREVLFDAYLALVQSDHKS